MFENKLRFLINSNTVNFECTFPKLLASIPESIPKEDILVVVGNSPKVNMSVCDRFYKLEVQHNSVDYTAFIALIEERELIAKHMVAPEFWFYLHDTCELGAQFIPKLSAFIPTLTKNKSLTLFPSMNLGIYRHAFFFEKPEILLSKRSSNLPKEEEVYQLKCGCVSTEDFLFKVENDTPFTGNVKGVKGTGPRRIYNGVSRITEYYEVLDLYKYKANWNGISPRDKVSRYKLTP
jgi:hypothetical protein